MHLITTNAVTYNQPLSGTVQGKVKARIRLVKERRLPVMSVNYDYLTGDGDEENLIESGTREFTEEELNGLFDAIKSTLPDLAETPWCQWRSLQLYSAFRYVMAEKLKIAIEDIQITE